MNIKENIKNFITDLVADKTFTCTKWMYIDDTWAIVAIRDDETNKLIVKLAKNIDGLQCDYDIDWNMPMTDTGDVFETEYTIESNSIDYISTLLAKDFKYVSDNNLK